MFFAIETQWHSFDYVFEKKSLLFSPSVFSLLFPHFPTSWVTALPWLFGLDSIFDCVGKGVAVFWVSLNAPFPVCVVYVLQLTCALITCGNLWLQACDGLSVKTHHYLKALVFPLVPVWLRCTWPVFWILHLGSACSLLAYKLIWISPCIRLIIHMFSYEIFRNVTIRCRNYTNWHI